MDAQFTAVIQKLIAEKGKETLFSAGKCKPLLADYTRGEYNKESRLLLQAVEAGAAKNIDGAADPANCKRLMIRKLQDDHFLSESAAADVVDMLALVLRGDVSAQGPADEDEWEPATASPSPQILPEQRKAAAPVTPPPSIVTVQAPPSVGPAAQTPVTPQPLPAADAKKRKDALALILLSIGAFVYFFIWFLALVHLLSKPYYTKYVGFILLVSLIGYGIIYALCALITGIKHHSKALKVFSVIATVLFLTEIFVTGLFANSDNQDYWGDLWITFNCITIGYTFFFAIFTLITAIRMRKTKPKETNQ